MFIDYQTLVLEDYKRKQEGNTLSQRLIHLTPANLKAECRAVCEERYNRKDEQLLSVFFGRQDDRDAYIAAIDRLNTNRFKPLVNFLRGEVSTTKEKNIELLAWLIDFDRRPFRHGERYEKDETEKKEKVAVEEADTGEQTGPSASPEILPLVSAGIPQKQKTSKPGDKLRLVVVVLSLIIIAVVLYLILRRQPQTGNCMYWTGDHYQEISCKVKMRGTLVIAYDSVRLNTLRKITTPDTITERAIGKVWYIKMDNELEFYTADGFHPVQIHRKLKPVSKYIICKYIRHNCQ